MRNRIISLILCLLCLSFFSPFNTVYAENEESAEDVTPVSTYTVSYGKGIYISYQGTEPNNFIKGTPPESQSVEQNGSVVVSENTFTFRDYSFGGWKYTYTDANGEKKSKYYYPGDVINNISCNMKLEATWTKKKEELKIDAFLVYADSNKKSNHYIGEITVLKNAPAAPNSSYSFCGWTDNEGKILYSPGDKYEIKSINTVIKPVWSVNGEKINYRKISVTTKGGGSASLSQIYILAGTSQNIALSPDEGYFLSSVTINGKQTEAKNSVSVTAENEDIYIEAVFEKIPTEPDVSEESSENTENDEYTINVNIEGNGSVSPAEKITVKKGDSTTLSFIPDENYQLPTKINDNGKDIFFDTDWNGKYVLENVNMSHEITICFKSKTPSDKSSEEYSNSPSDKKEEDSSTFTMWMCGAIVVFAVVFGIISINYSKKSKRKKSRKKKSQKRK